MRLCFSVKIAELAARANAAGGIPLRADGLHSSVPHVARLQPPVERLFAPRQELHRFGDLERSDKIHDRPEHADRVARLFESWRATLDETREAGSQARSNRHRYAVTRHRGGINPRPPGFHRDIIDEKSRLKIVGAVQDDVEPIEQLLRVARAYVGHDALNAHSRVDAAKFALRRHSLWQRITRVGFVEEELTAST